MYAVVTLCNACMVDLLSSNPYASPYIVWYDSLLSLILVFVFLLMYAIYLVNKDYY